MSTPKSTNASIGKRTRGGYCLPSLFSRMRGVLSGQVVFLFRRQFFLLIEAIPPGQPADQGADARYEEPEHSDNQSNHSENNVAEARFYKAGRVSGASGSNLIWMDLPTVTEFAKGPNSPV